MCVESAVYGEAWKRVTPLVLSVEARLCDEKERGSVSLTRLRDKKGVSALCVTRSMWWLEIARGSHG